MANEIFIADGLTEGDKVRLARLARNWRQVDLACYAQVNPVEVTAIEKNRWLRKVSKKRILITLGLLEGPNESENEASS